MNCYECPFSTTGKDTCLTDGSQMGKSLECDVGNNACATLIIDDDSAPFKYNRRCGINPGKDGCVKTTVWLNQWYKGQVCYCTTGDNCNTDIWIGLQTHCRTWI